MAYEVDSPWRTAMRRCAITVGCLLAIGTVFIILGRLGVIPDAVGSGIAGPLFFIVLVILAYAYQKYQRSSSHAYLNAQMKAPLPEPLLRSSGSTLATLATPPERDIYSLLNNPLTGDRLREDLKRLTTTHTQVQWVTNRRVPSSDPTGLPLWEEQSAPRPAPGFAPLSPPANRPRSLRRSLPPDYGQRR